MATFVKFHCYVKDLHHAVHDFSADVLKVMLTNTAPDAAVDTVDGDITEITPEDGYVVGGETVVSTAEGQTGGIYTYVANDVVITPDNPGSFGPAQYPVLYNSSKGTAGNRPLIGYWDRGSAITPTDGVPLTLDITGALLTAQ